MDGAETTHEFSLIDLENKTLAKAHATSDAPVTDGADRPALNGPR